MVFRRLPGHPFPATALREALAEAEPLAMTEYRPERGARAGTVRAGWRGAALCVLAELDRPNPATTAAADGDPIWTLGDCFEIFLKRPGSPDYAELHVSPGGHVLQLRFPRRRTPGGQRLAPRDLIREYGVPERRMRAAAAIRPDGSGWEAFAEIDLAGLGLAGASLEGTELDISFCVCNFTRRPIIYQGSTSVLEVLDVHLHSQWRRAECAA